MKFYLFKKRVPRNYFSGLLMSFLIMWMSVSPAQAIILYGSGSSSTTTTNTTTDSDFFILDNDDSNSGSISLQFGNTLSEYLQFDVTQDRFELSDDLSLEGGELENFRLDNEAVAPNICNGTTDGQFYYNTSSDQMLICNGTTGEYVVHSDFHSNMVFVDFARPLKTGEVYATISSAAAYVSGQSPGAGSMWVIVLQPGTFSESFTVPQYTVLMGEEYTKTVLTGTVTLSNFSTLQNVTVNGGGEVDIASGNSGYIEYSDVYINDAGSNGIDGTLVISRSFVDGMIGATGVVQAYDSVVGPTGLINNGSIGTYHSAVLNFTNNAIWNNFGVAYDNTVLPVGSRLTAENSQDAIDELVSEGIPNANFTLDKDNAGTGANVSIIANQGADQDGIIRYNSSLNKWELSNNGVDYGEIATAVTISIDFDDAYNSFGATPSVVFVDSAEGQTGGLTFTGSLAADETVSISNSGDGGGLNIENTGSGASLRVNDQSGDLTPFIIDELGEIGIGTSSPDTNLHFYDSSSSLVTEWMKFDDGTNQVSMLTGTQDPTVTATDADIGSFFFNTANGLYYVKQDDGLTVNWNKIGLTMDTNNALLGTFGTPSLTNKFVTHTDPRLSQTSGEFGEVALGTHLDYTISSKISKALIYYTRVFLPSHTMVSSIGAFTTQVVTGDVNMALYSDNSGPDIKLAETGTQSGVPSTLNGYWRYNLTAPYQVTEAGFYWLAITTSVEPFARSYNSAIDVFVPYRVTSKVLTSDTTLPATAVPVAKSGTGRDLPFLAAFE